MSADVGPGWTPADEQDVLMAIEEDWIGIDPAFKAKLVPYLIDPQPASIERFGTIENAFVVARVDRFVVFFEDIEEIFGTAEESEGRLSNVSLYDNIAVALHELVRLASS